MAKHTSHAKWLFAKVKGSALPIERSKHSPNVVNKMEEREAFFDAIDFLPRMVEMLRRPQAEYFRWFESGTWTQSAWVKYY